jgi:hypothetical protein
MRAMTLVRRHPPTNGRVTLISIARSTDGHDSDYLQILSYLSGVADAVAALSEDKEPLLLRPGTIVPLSVVPLSLHPSWMGSTTFPPHALRFLSDSPQMAAAALELRESLRSDRAGRRDTSRFGELPFHTPSAWPMLAFDAPEATTRGGTRVVEFDSNVPSRTHDLAVVRCLTIPYDTRIAPTTDSDSDEVDWGDRISEVRLLTVPLVEEWYELAGIAAPTHEELRRDDPRYAQAHQATQETLSQASRAGRRLRVA